MNTVVTSAPAVAGFAQEAPSLAQVTLHEQVGIEGRSFTTERSVDDHWRLTSQCRGREHPMQITSPPSATVTVRRADEARA
jgi:hypothetical protein